MPGRVRIEGKWCFRECFAGVGQIIQQIRLEDSRLRRDRPDHTRWQRYQLEGRDKEENEERDIRPRPDQRLRGDERPSDEEQQKRSASQDDDDLLAPGVHNAKGERTKGQQRHQQRIDSLVKPPGDEMTTDYPVIRTSIAVSI